MPLQQSVLAFDVFHVLAVGCHVDRNRREFPERIERLEHAAGPVALERRQQLDRETGPSLGGGLVVNVGYVHCFSLGYISIRCCGISTLIFSGPFPPRRIRGELLGVDAADRKVPCLGMPQHQPAGSLSRHDHVRFGHCHAGYRPDVHQREDVGLERMIGSRRIAESGADALILLGEQVPDAPLPFPLVAPQRHAGIAMQRLGERLRQPVGEQLGHDRAIVVALGAVAAGQFLEPEARRHGERPDVVLHAAAERSDEIGQDKFRSRSAC